MFLFVLLFVLIIYIFKSHTFFFLLCCIAVVDFCCCNTQNIQYSHSLSNQHDIKLTTTTNITKKRRILSHSGFYFTWLTFMSVILKSISHNKKQISIEILPTYFDFDCNLCFYLNLIQLDIGVKTSATLRRRHSFRFYQLELKRAQP